MRKKLFTKAIDTMLFKQYAYGSDLEKQKVAAKIFNPYGRGRWYILNSDPQDPDYLWAIVEMGDEIEIGSVSREDLETMKVPPFRLNLERDLYFTPTNAKEVYDGLRRGQFFAKGGDTGVELVENKTNEYYLTPEDAKPDTMAIKLGKGGSITLPVSKSISEKDINEFVEYVEGFYGKKGIYADDLNGGFTKKEIKEAVMKYISDLDKNPTWGYGDSLDRERVRQYLDPEYSLLEKGGNIESYKLFDFNEKGNLSALINDKYYEVIYRDDISQLYDLFEDNVLIKSSEYVRDLLMYPEPPKVIRTQFEEEEFEFGNGGKIKDQYEGRTPEDVWNNLSKQQRQHFLYDHSEDIEDYRGDEYGDLTSKEIIKAYNSNYSELDKNIRNRFDNHVREGQYRKGGYMAKGGEIKVDVGDMIKSKTVKGRVYESMGTMFKLEDEYGNKNPKYYSTRDFKKSEIIKMAKGGYMENGGNTSDGMEVVNYLKSVSGLRASYIAQWGDLNNVNLYKVQQAIKTKKLKPIDFSTALSGRDGNKYAKDIIKKYSQNKMAKGGKTKFMDKVKSIQSSLLKRKKVSPSVQKDYGKTYSKSEALDSAKRIAGSMRAEEMSKKKG